MKATIAKWWVAIGALCLMTQTAIAGAVDPSDVQRLIREGTALHGRGQFDGALEKYRAVLALNPAHAEAHYEIVATLYAKKAWQDCIDAANSALQTPSPFRARLFVANGNCLDESGQRERAIATYEAGLREFSRHPELGLNLAIAIQKGGDVSRSLSLMEKVLDDAPTYRTANFDLGRVYARQG
jgi:tetratricopeptide (TPR) repeat protein